MEHKVSCQCDSVLTEKAARFNQPANKRKIKPIYQFHCPQVPLHLYFSVNEFSSKDCKSLWSLPVASLEDGLIAFHSCTKPVGLILLIKALHAIHLSIPAPSKMPRTQSLLNKMC